MENKCANHERDSMENINKEIKDPIIAKVVDKIIGRSNFGVEKYGTTLEDNNVDDFLTHLQEELMDAVNYIEKLKSQKK